MPKADRSSSQVLDILKDRLGTYVSGNFLAAAANLSRTGVWKHIRKLKAQGYHILTHPKEGYQLVDLPDRLTPEEVLPHLRTSWLGQNYHHYVEIGSTNDQAMLLATRGAPHGTTVVAEEQTRGRGRMKRTWVSPPGCGIYVSTVFVNPLPLRVAPQSTTAASLALVRVLRRHYSLPALIKWPNDVLIGGRKIAGVLAEMQSDQDFTRFLVIGVGINVNQKGRDLAGPFRYPAGSLATELGFEVSRRDLLVAFLQEFERVYETFEREGFEGILPEYKALSAMMGKRIRVQRGDEEIAGVASGFSSEGALELLREDGTLERLWVGDVTRIGNFDAT